MHQPATSPTYQPGATPIPGYRLIEPLGQGGFGEVWKCEAPGGLFKAIKFVAGNSGASSAATQERTALERVKTLRHPFLLSLERVEVIDELLVIVMELADKSLYTLFNEYRDSGQIGIPREELLGYLLEAAEALDWMNFEHGLQHLDVKPHNLFLVTNHVKVADFGLVHQIGDERGKPGVRKGGVTPLYSAPEMLRGTLSRNSDQYSLAVVYQQLLTQTVPFWHENIYELMMQHLTGEPDLEGLPEGDRPIVARALAKLPDARYPSCLDFVHALLKEGGLQPRRSGHWRRMLSGERSSANPVIPSATLEPLSTQPFPPPTPILSPFGDITTRQTQLTNRIGENLPLTQTPTRPIRVKHQRGAPSSSQPARNEQHETPQPAGGIGECPPSQPVHGLPNIPSSSFSSAEDQPYPEAAFAPGPTAVSLPGYRFASCLSQGPLADLWRAEDANGQPRRAMCLLNFVRYDARLIEHLRALRDPLLPPTEVHWSPAERLVVLAPWLDGTLGEYLEARKAEGLAGIPRWELLPFLRSAAEALDALYARYGLQHMGLHPRNLLVDGDRLWLSDFGLVPLVWLPTGQSAGVLNGRYAAPELFDRRPTRTADQYSLALIYAEMLTGVSPRPYRPASGIHRRPMGRGGGPNRKLPIDLDLLPSHDREIVKRALAMDSEKRFPSCTAFIEALEKAQDQLPEQMPRYADLPGVIPYASLLGEPPGPEVVLPTVQALVTRLTTVTQARTQHGPQNMRYTVRADGTWEYHCPLQLFPGAMPIKLEGLRGHWNARLVQMPGEIARLQIEVPVPRSFWERVVKQSKQLEVDIEVLPATGTSRLTEALVQVRYPGDNQEQTQRVLEIMAPQVFESVRRYFQATPEQRTKDRWPLRAPLRIYPVLPDLELAPTVEGMCKNISVGGISFRAERKPPVDYLYLHLYDTSAALGYAVLARVMRVHETKAGVEVGATFPTGDPR